MDLPASGNSQIDAGHDRLLALLEKLRYNPPDVAAVIQELGERLDEHFREEEALMKSARYRGANAHAAEHQALLALLTEELPDAVGKAAENERVLQAVDRSRQVFMDHILGLDHSLALYLVRKAMRAEGSPSRKKPPRKAPTARPKRPGKV